MTVMQQNTFDNAGAELGHAVGQPRRNVAAMER